MHLSHERRRRRSGSPIHEDYGAMLVPRMESERSEHRSQHLLSHPPPQHSRPRHSSSHMPPPPPQHPSSRSNHHQQRWRQADHPPSTSYDRYDSYSQQPRDDYYNAPEEQWPSRPTHFSEHAPPAHEWSDRQDRSYSSSYQDDRSWQPGPSYAHDTYDRWNGDVRDTHDTRDLERHQSYGKDDGRRSDHVWTQDQTWSNDRGSDSHRGWDAHDTYDLPVEEDRAWKPAPNWQERRRDTRRVDYQQHQHHHTQPPNSRNTIPKGKQKSSQQQQSNNRKGWVRPTNPPQTDAPKDNGNHKYKRKDTSIWPARDQDRGSQKRRRSTSPTPSRSRSRSSSRSKSPKRPRREYETRKESKSLHRRSASQESRSTYQSDARPRGRRHSVSSLSSRSPSPQPSAKRSIHRLPAPRPLNATDDADSSLRRRSRSPSSNRRRNGHPNSNGKHLPNEEPAVHEGDARIVKASFAKNRTAAPRTSPNKASTSNRLQSSSALVKRFFPGDEDEPESPVLEPAPSSSRHSDRRFLPARDDYSPPRPDDRLSYEAQTSRSVRAPSLSPPHQRDSSDGRDTREFDDRRRDDDVSEPSVPRSELYKIVAKVGEGTFGQVYKAQNTITRRFVALKRIRMEAEREGFPVTAMREIKLLQSLRHDNVIKLLEMMVSKGAVYMVFEYMDHDLTGVLLQNQFTFTPAHIKSLCHQMLSGLAYLHLKGVIHRDIKGSNILLNNRGELKLADFGLARFYQKRRQADYTNRVITLWYRPPELLLGNTIYGPEVDMWSAGCIMLELFTRRPVFQGGDEIHQLQVIYRWMGAPDPADWPELTSLPWYELVKPKETSKSHFRESFQKYMSPAALDLAEALLCYNPSRRETAAKSLEAPYFVSEDPPAEMPSGLSSLEGEWHELESKKERAERAKVGKRKAESDGGVEQ